MEADALLFDLDGTLWDATDEILLTWNKVLSESCNLRGAVSKSELQSYFGLQMDEIAKRMLPDASSATQMYIINLCTEAENKYLYTHGAKLYDDLETVLERLSEQYTLCIVSNCQKGYIEAFLKAHQLEQYFNDYICFGDTGLRKGESMLEIVRRNGYRHPVYIGDTQGDMLEARYAGYPFVFAAYGFGKAEDYDAVISSPEELLSIFCKGSI